MSKTSKLEWGLNKEETEKWIDQIEKDGRFTKEQIKKLREANERR
jgi:hypothetical protein